jgi:hypothetical protein
MTAEHWIDVWVFVLKFAGMVFIAYLVSKVLVRFTLGAVEEAVEQRTVAPPPPAAAPQESIRIELDKLTDEERAEMLRLLARVRDLVAKR